MKNMEEDKQDKDKYQESVEEKSPDMDRMKSLMGNLNNFLSK